MRPRTFVTRGLALVALASLGFTAACEDNTTPPVVTPVTVTVVPPTLTLGPGQTGQFAAAVAGGTANGDRTVTWASSNPAVVSVDQTGKVTVAATVATATTVTITATSKQDATAVGAGAVNVTATPTEPVPGTPTITIKDITTPGGGTVNAQNIAGPINVLMDVDVPQGAQVQRIEVLLDGNVVCTIPFTGTGAAKPGDATTEGTEVVQAICPINTAAADSTGKPSFANGPHTLSARLVGPSGTAASSIEQTIIFNNVNTVTPTITTSKASATDLRGLVWQAGDVTVKLTPVIFTGGQTVSRVTVTLTPITQGGSVTLTDTTAADGFSVTFPASKTLASGGVSNVQDSVTLTISTVTSNGQAGPTNTTGPQLLRLDNVAPVITQFNITPNQFLGLNTSFTATGVVTSADNANGVLGVDRQTVTFSVAPAADTTGGFTAVTAGSALTEGSTVVIKAVVTDALGNSKTYFVGANNTVQTSFASAGSFFVDLTRPVVAKVTASATKSQVIGGVTVSVTAKDTSVAGGIPSGFSANPVRQKQVRYIPSGSSCQTTSGSSCVFASAGLTFPVAAVSGYDSVSVFVVDAAGNASDTTKLLVLQDATAPTIGLIQPPNVTAITGGTQVSFTAPVSDNIDLASASPFLTYAGFSGAIEFPSTTLGGFGPNDGFATSANASLTLASFVAGIQATDATGAPVGTVYGASSVQISVTDQVGLSATSSALSIAPIVTVPAANYAALTSFNVQASPATVCTEAPNGGDCGTTAATTTLTAVAAGNGPFVNPISSVSFYFFDGTNWVLLGSSSSASITADVNNNQVVTYTLSVSADDLPAGTVPVIAIAQNTAGLGLVSPSKNVTVQNP